MSVEPAAPPAYERDPYATTLQVRVLQRGEQDGAEWVVFDDTILYPEGGGQPADRGCFEGVAVLDVQKVDGVVRHTLAGRLPAASGTLELDWSRRYDHMQQHTSQHLLTAIAADRFGWHTTSFHLGERRCDIELDAPIQELSAARLERLEQEVAAAVRQALAVRARSVAREEFERLPVRTRGLPAGHTGDVRLIEIEGLDLCSCGGTHLRSTAEIEAVVLLDTEPMRGGTRLYWLAGGRVRALLRERERLAAGLRAALGERLARLQAAERRSRWLERQLAEVTAERLAEGAEPFVEAHFEGFGMAFLQGVARALLQSRPDRVALLTGGETGGEAVFVLAAGGDSGADARALGSLLAQALDGRGGGSKELFQGKVASLRGREEAVGRVRSALPGSGPGPGVDARR